MKATKLSISMDPELCDEVRRAARNSGKGTSAWLAEAAAAKLRAEALDAFLEDWQATDGPFTPEELARAELRLGHTPAEPNQ